MFLGEIIRCVKGGGGLIEEELYTIKRITENGNILLYEVNPPQNYTSFKRDRFEEIDTSNFYYMEFPEDGMIE